MKTASSSLNIEQQLREMNEALLISSLHQHELAEQAQQAEAALRVSEQRFRTLFELGPVAVYTCDVSGVILEFNRHAAELWGRAPALGDTDERFCGSFRMIRPDGSVLAHDQCPMAEVLSGTIPHARDAEVRIDQPDGSRITVVVNIHPLKNERGEITGAINCFYDVTERKRAEEASGRLAAIVTSSDDAIISTELHGIITSWNRGAQRLFGYAAEEAIGKSVSLLIPDDCRDEEPRILSIIRQGESIEHHETVRRRKDGRLLDISLTVSPIKNSVGQIIGASKVARDITERKQNEAALRQSEDRYRNLFNSMDEGYCIIEMIFDAHDKPVDYRFLEVNRAFEKQSGMHDVIGKRMLEFVPSIEEHWLANYGSAALTGESVRFANEYKTLNRWFDVYAFRIGAPGSRKVAVLFCDITARKQSEDALDRARDEAEAANRAKDLFLATLSHEVRTPLSAIIGWMQILQGGLEGGCTEAELNEGLDVIERNARTMVQLLDDVMDVSRIISGKVRLEVRPCDLSEVVRAGIDVVRSAARAKDITLSAELDPAASAASCDAARMQQVVWNLISNAIKFTPKEGEVHVKLARDGSDVRIDVTDTGQGIDQELLPYVFDRFRQADSSTRRQYGGLGLGLSIVKHLVELHGGTVQAQSEGEGLGSTFSVRLPIRAVRTDESDGPDEDESELSSTKEPPVVRLDALRVLVVDDEPDARRLLVKVLGEAGAVVTSAASAAEAIAALVDSNPEVLVSDLGMPDRDGFDLIRQIRACGYHAKDLPAVALSAFVQKKDQRQSLLAGFQMHVAKPATPHDLTAAIASLAGRAGPAIE